VINELYYPTIDLPQIRDLQYLVTDAATFFHDGRRNFDTVTEQLDPDAFGFRLTNTAKNQPYKVIEEVISDPNSACLLVHPRVEATPTFLERLHLYVLLAPHLQGRGQNNNGYLANSSSGRVLVANRGDAWLALGATIPFLRGIMRLLTTV